MSTVQFHPVEAFIAMPNAAVFSRMPATFGREWTLRLPAIDLSALYAAVSRTFCLSAEMFRAISRWDRGRLEVDRMRESRLAGEGVAGKEVALETAAPRHVPVAEPVGDGGGRHADADVGFEPARRSSWTVAASAGAVGGVLLVAGLAAHLVAEYAPQHGARHPVGQVLNPARREVVSASAPVVADVVAAGDQQHSEQHSEQQSEALARHLAREPAGQYAVSPEVALMPATVSPPPQAAASPVQTVADAQTRRTSRREPRGTVQHRAEHADAMPVTTRRASGTYSHAGAYSPHRPAAVPAEEYGSLDMFANTYAGESHPVSSTVPADDTSWAAHVTQRRITDIPEQFSK